MRIGEVAKRAGIRTSTLRYYEEIGLIHPPRRTNGQRDYDGDIFEVLRIIQVLQNAGFSLDEIRLLIHTDEKVISRSAYWQEIARQKLVEIERIIQHYQSISAMLERGVACECTELKVCVLFST